MDNVRECFAKDAFAASLGIELVDVSPGTAVARMQVEDRHLNSFGIAHGAAIFALADFAFAVACNSHGTVAVAVSATIAFAKAGAKEMLTARAREVARSRKIGTYAIDVTDPAGQIVATFQGTAYRKSDPLP